MKTTRIAIVPALLLASATVNAQSFAPSPTHDDRFTIKVSAFDTDSRIKLGAHGRARYEGMPFSAAWDARGDIEGGSTNPHLQAMFRITDRQRLSFGYYKTDDGRSYDFSRAYDLSGYDDFFDEYEEYIGEYRDAQGNFNGDGSFDIDFRLANLMYEYALVQNETWMLGARIGITWADLDFNARARVAGQVEGGGEAEADAFEADYQWRRTRWAPTIGLRAMYSPNANWRFSAEAEGFETGWGNFTSEDGHFERFGVNAEYRFTRNFGVHVGYDWFRLKLSDNIRGGFNNNELTYNGRASGELRVHGPTLGLTFAF